MKRLLTITMIAAMAVGCGSSKSGETVPKGSVINLAVDEFAETISRKEVKLIDVRTSKEYNEGYIVGAENIDVMASDFDERTKDFRNEVAVYCRSGKRSMAAAEKLASRGCTVYNLDGGILAWNKANRPTSHRP